MKQKHEKYMDLAILCLFLFVIAAFWLVACLCLFIFNVDANFNYPLLLFFFSIGGYILFFKLSKSAENEANKMFFDEWDKHMEEQRKVHEEFAKTIKNAVNTDSK